jgi:hypothetical protein
MSASAAYRPVSGAAEPSFQSVSIESFKRRASLD